MTILVITLESNVYTHINIYVIRKKWVYEYKLTNNLLKSYKKNYIFIIIW